MIKHPFGPGPTTRKIGCPPVWDTPIAEAIAGIVCKIFESRIVPGSWEATSKGRGPDVQWSFLTTDGEKVIFGPNRGWGGPAGWYEVRPSGQHGWYGKWPDVKEIWWPDVKEIWLRSSKTPGG